MGAGTVIAIIAVVLFAILIGMLLIVLFSLKKRVNELLEEVKNTVTQLNAETMPKVGGTIDNLNAVLQSVQELSESELKPTVHNVQGITGQLNEGLGATIENLNNITASIQQLSETEIKEIASNIQNVTATFSEDAEKIDTVVTTAQEFTTKTIDMAAFYREKLFVPIIDILSFWNAMKTVLATITHIRTQNEVEEETSGK